MKINKLTIRKPKIFFDAILVFLVIYFNNETLSNNLCTFMEQPTRIVAVVAAVFAVYRIIRYRDNIKVKVALFSIVLIALVIVARVIDGSYTNGYMLLIMGIFNGMIVAMFIPFQRFCELFIKISFFLAAASILFSYPLKPLLRFAPFIFPRVTNSAGISFYNAHVCYVNTSTTFFRNYGIFREPGVYAIFLCFSLTFLIFVTPKSFSRKKQFIYIGVVAAALVTTFSTTGYVAALMIVLTMLLSSKERHASRGTILLVAALIVLVVMYLFVFEKMENPLDKFDSSSKSYSSYQYRLETIVNGAICSLRQPFGYGLQNGINALQNANSLKTYHNTSTWISMSVYLGVPYFLLCGFALFEFFRKKTKAILLFLPFFLLLSGETLVYNPLIYIFFMYGLTSSASYSICINEMGERRVLNYR